MIKENRRMKHGFKLTKNPRAGKKKTVKGAKRVFNLDGDLLCFLKRGRLYDLNAKVIAPCVSVKGLSEEEIAKTRGYCEDGKKVYFYGEETGIIEKRDRFIAILIFFIALTVAAIAAMSVAICIAEKNKVKEITIIDKDGRWEADAKLDIFGDELLKPGAKGEYLFMVHNPNAFGMKGDIEISFTYGNETENLPIIIYALTVNGKKTEVHKTENGYYVNDVVINKNAKNSFVLAWEWKFDGESDEKDTELGRKGEKYECGIFITAEEN